MTTHTGSFAGPSRNPAGSEGGGSSSDGKSTPKKQPPMSRLGRGLGALIPAAATRSPGSPPQTAGPAAVTAEPKLTAPVPPSPTTGAEVPSGDSASMAQNNPPKPARSSVLVAATHAAGSIPTTPSAPLNAASASATGRPSGAPESVLTDERSTWNTNPEQSIIAIPIARIQRNPRQPRERFDDNALRSLADSIRQDGLLQPIVVRASKVISASTGVQMYELIAGERRLRAFTLLGRSTIPALIQRVDDRTSAVLALIENVQREDLNPMERAYGLQKLMHEFAFSQQDLAARVGLDRSTVANLLRLNDLDTNTASALREGAITTGHAKALLALSDASMRKALVSRIIAEGLSVRELEGLVRHTLTNTPSSGTPGRLPPSGRVISAQVADLERRIGAHLGTEVQLKTGRKPGSGAITIKFGSHDEFEGLMERFGFDLEASDRPRGR